MVMTGIEPSRPTLGYTQRSAMVVAAQAYQHLVLRLLSVGVRDPDYLRRVYERGKRTLASATAAANDQPLSSNAVEVLQSYLDALYTTDLDAAEFWLGLFPERIAEIPAWSRFEAEEQAEVTTGLSVEAAVGDAPGVATRLMRNLALHPRMGADPRQDDIAADGRLEIEGRAVIMQMIESPKRVALVAAAADDEALDSDVIAAIRERLVAAFVDIGAALDTIVTLPLRSRGYPHLAIHDRD